MQHEMKLLGNNVLGDLCVLLNQKVSVVEEVTQRDVWFRLEANNKRLSNAQKKFIALLTSYAYLVLKKIVNERKNRKTSSNMKMLMPRQIEMKQPPDLMIIWICDNFSWSDDDM